MKLTLSWLKTHLDTDATLGEITAALTMLGLEVDGVTDRGTELAPFRVARIVEAHQHPNADKLRVCAVDTGTEQLQVVCGAPNARTGLLTVFAPPGTAVVSGVRGDIEDIENKSLANLIVTRQRKILKVSDIRGVTSNGMLCSAWEIGITDFPYFPDQEGILEISGDTIVGTPFADYAGLNDPLLDVKITANRADCLGVRGIARDLAAAGMGLLKPLHVDPVLGEFSSPIDVSISDTKACPLFLGRLIKGVRNAASPKWLADRLISIGLRPISALVDITNFMTFDLCRPLHVFDAAKIRGDLRVHPAEGGEVLAALNGKEYVLEPGMTAISDASGVLSLGGVIGGASTGCGEATTDVFIEAALFDTVRTAATGRALNLQSDARYRFERGLDPAFVFDAMEIATRLVFDLCGGSASDIVAAGMEPDWHRTVTLRPARVASLGGLSIADGEIHRALSALGCRVIEESAGFTVGIPSWRADIEGEADLVEEVLRIHGYDDIPAVSLTTDTALPLPAIDAAQRRAGFVRRTLANRGLDEAVTFSFTSSALLAASGVFGTAKPELVVANPISAELDLMRPSILPNLLSAAKRNADRGMADGALFELGPQYADDTPEGQRDVAAGIRTGRTNLKTWNEAGRPIGALDAKADALAALAAAGAPVDNLQVTADPPGWYHPGRGGSIRLGPKTMLAHFGEIHPRLMTALDLKGPAAGFEVYLDAVPPTRAKGRGAFKPSALQPLERDFAFIVDDTVTAEQLLRAAKGADRKLITDIRLFDVYTGPGVPDGKKSLAITVTLQPVEATLTDKEIEAFSAALVGQVAKATGGVLRG